MSDASPSPPPAKKELTSEEVASDARRRIGIILIVALFAAGGLFFQGILPVDVGLVVAVPRTLSGASETLSRTDVASAEARVLDADNREVARATWPFPGGMTAPASSIQTVSIPSGEYMVHVALYLKNGGNLTRVQPILAKTDSTHTISFE